MPPQNIEQLEWRLDYLEKERLRALEGRKADKSDLTREADLRTAADDALGALIKDAVKDIEEIKANTKWAFRLGAATLLTSAGSLLVVILTRAVS